MLTPMPTAPARGATFRSTRIVAAVLVVLVSLVLAGCHSDKQAAASQTKPQSQPVEGGKTLAAVWPLTGEPVTGATPRRPVLVTKIDNSSASRPQIGLKQADLITEELVEGGITRLAVFYYQQLPPVAGPGALHARLRHRDRQAGARHHRGQWRRPAHAGAAALQQHHLLRWQRSRLLPRRQPDRARTT